MTQALDGVRVLDLSNRLSGAFAARMFGDFGAEVILAEPEDGHVLRREAPFAADGEGSAVSLLHSYANWNKRSIAIRDTAELLQLASSANVVVTTEILPYSTGLAAALEVLPSDAIHLSITPHGVLQ